MEGKSTYFSSNSSQTVMKKPPDVSNTCCPPLTFYSMLCSVSSTHRLDEDVSDGLRVVPLAHAGGHLLQEVLVVLQDLGNLVKHVVHQQRVHDGAAVGLFERTHVALGGEKSPVNQEVMESKFLFFDKFVSF